MAAIGGSCDGGLIGRFHILGGDASPYINNTNIINTTIIIFIILLLAKALAAGIAVAL